MNFLEKLLDLHKNSHKRVATEFWNFWGATALKKKSFGANEIAIFDDACIYKQGEYWHFWMRHAKEKCYVRRNLKITSRATAVELAKNTNLDSYANLRQGKTFLKITAKEGAEKYLQVRRKDWELGNR